MTELLKPDPPDELQLRRRAHELVDHECPADVFQALLDHYLELNSRFPASTDQWIASLRLEWEQRFGEATAARMELDGIAERIYK